jgi:hypothetical protein
MRSASRLCFLGGIFQIFYSRLCQVSDLIRGQTVLGTQSHPAWYESASIAVHHKIWQKLSYFTTKYKGHRGRKVLQNGLLKDGIARESPSRC